MHRGAMQPPLQRQHPRLCAAHARYSLLPSPPHSSAGLELGAAVEGLHPRRVLIGRRLAGSQPMGKGFPGRRARGGERLWEKKRGGDCEPAGRERRAAANHRGRARGRARAGGRAGALGGTRLLACGARRLGGVRGVSGEARRGPPTPPPSHPPLSNPPPPNPPPHPPPVPFAAGAAGAWAVHGHRQEHAAHPARAAPRRRDRTRPARGTPLR